MKSLLVFNSLEWGLNSQPEPHAFISLPLQSNSLYIVGNFTLILSVCIIILTLCACLTIYNLYLLRHVWQASNIRIIIGHLIFLFRNLKGLDRSYLNVCFFLAIANAIIFSCYFFDLTNFKEVDSTCFFDPLEPSTSATGPIDNPFPSNSINDVPDPRSSPNDQNQGRPTVNLGYEILSDQARGSQGRRRVAIFDWLQPSGNRLSELFTAKPYLYYEPTHATEQMVVKGQPRVCVIKELMEQTTLPGSNERGVWVNAFPQYNLGSDHYDIKSANSDIVRVGRRMFLKE